MFLIRIIISVQSLITGVSVKVTLNVFEVWKISSVSDSAFAFASASFSFPSPPRRGLLFSGTWRDSPLGVFGPPVV